MSPQAGYVLQEQVVPRLRSAIPKAVCFVGAEDAEELIQDATAMAAKLLHNVEKAGKKVTPGNIAYYTIQHMKSGRRSTGTTVVDVLGTGTQLNGSSRMTSLEEAAAVDAETGGEIFLFHDVLSNDQEDPSMAVARKMDWETFMQGLSQRERAIILSMLEGKTFREAANKLRVGDSTIQASKQSQARSIQSFMGTDILIEVRRSPKWKNNLNANKERLACRRNNQ